MARRRDRARGAYRSYRAQAAERSGVNTLRGEWRKLPGPVRTFTPIVILLGIAIAVSRSTFRACRRGTCR